MKVLDVLDQVITQAEFAQMVGVSEARISQLLSDEWMTRGEKAAQWLLAYCERLRDQAAGRLGSEMGGLDPVHENAALKRAQREGVEIKNSVLRGEFAPIKLLAEVLADASQGVSERFEQLPGQLRKACPDLPPAAVDQVMATIAAARNEWVRATAELAARKFDDSGDGLPDYQVEGESA